MNRQALLMSAIGGVPDNYLVIDTETNGMSVRDELVLPTQLGYLLVVGRAVVDRGAVVINWAKILPRDLRLQFWDRVRKVEWHMSRNGGRCMVTSDRIAAEGADPHEAWPAYQELLATALARQIPVAGHNIVRFDCPLLERVGLQMETTLTFDPDLVLDFGLIEKACATGLPIPEPGAPRGPWYRHIGSAYSCEKWNLAHCLAKYEITVPSSPGIGLHDAGHDCLASHLMIEAYRRLATVPVAVAG